ncbi:MAG: TolC family protein [Gemmataceae bacterium]
MFYRVLPRLLGITLVLVAGCHAPIQERVDDLVCSLASYPLDPWPVERQDGQSSDQENGGHSASVGSVTPTALRSTLTGFTSEPEIPLPPPRKGIEELPQVPPGLPGADVRPLRLSPIDPAHPEKRLEEIERLMPAMQPLGGNPRPGPGPNGCPLTLADLQRVALSSNPLIRQAVADLEAAKGEAVQAGLYPNPTTGFQGDTFAMGGTPGTFGAVLAQTIKTGGKLKLAQAAAAMQVANAELAVQRVKYDLVTRVRASYFAVLVAQQNMRAKEVFARFTAEAYRLQVDLLKAAQIAVYEPLQFHVLALEARAEVIRARNRYIAAWKELTTALGTPGMPPTELAGQIDAPIPSFEYDRLLTWILNHHTDVKAALNLAQKARYELRLAQVGPIPDVDVELFVGKDYTTPPQTVMGSIAVTFPLPVWDRNQGNISKAQGELLRANEEAHRVRLELTSELARAFENYQNSRVILRYYRDHILPDQVRVYRSILARYQQEPDKVDFTDVVVAQQNLAQAITTYIAVLGELWDAVVAVAHLLQTDDLFQIGPGRLPLENVMGIPELPCCHPCSPVPESMQRGIDGRWPREDE